jgi:hypothetical protein
VVIGWSRGTGSLTLLRLSEGVNLLAAAEIPASVDVALDSAEGWLSQRSFARFLRYSFEPEQGSCIATIEVGLGPLIIADRYEILGQHVRRSVRVVNAGDATRLYSVRMLVPLARIEPIEHCFFDAPGNSVRPRVELVVAAAQHRAILPRRFFAPGLRGNSALEPAPNQGPGLLALHNDAARVSLLCSFYSTLRAALPYLEGTIFGQNDAVPAVTLAHEIGVAERLPEGGSIEVGTQEIVLVAAGWPDALTWYTSNIAQELVDAADWLRDTTICTTDAAIYGGFRRLAATLEELRVLGIGTIALLPIWKGPPRTTPLRRDDYSVSDFERIAAHLGDDADLVALIHAAHQLNMRILLDLPLQGCAADSPLLHDHPDWFARDLSGAFIVGQPANAPAVHRHPGGYPPEGVYLFDWANPGLRDYWRDWMQRQCVRFALDGFRIYNPGPLAPQWGRQQLPIEASTHALLAELRTILRQHRPAAALIGTLSGPLYDKLHDASYDTPAHAMFVHMALNRITPREMCQYLADYKALLPQRMRMGFMESQDTSRHNPLADGLRGSRISRMLMAGMLFCGYIPALWHGQLGEDAAFYQRLLHIWQDHAALRYGTLDLRCVSSSTASAFTVLRRHAGRVYLGVLNVDARWLDTSLHIDAASLQLRDGRYIIDNLFTGLRLSSGSVADLPITLEPYGFACGVLEEA